MARKAIAAPNSTADTGTDNRGRGMKIAVGGKDVVDLGTERRSGLRRPERSSKRVPKHP